MLMPEQRFWKHVNKCGPDDCWPWTGGLSHNGYGQLRGRIRNSCVRAHRVSYELEYGPIPEGSLCLHRCDNPQCVNPKHLFLGTQFENIQDKMRKGRAAHGVRHGRAKLNPGKIKQARIYREKGWTYQQIADHFKVSRGAIHHALFYRLNWRDAE